MHRILGKKAAIAGMMALAILALTAAVAVAAPVLQPGQTSAPGMSGTCTNCHTYAKSVVAKPAPLLPSHPYLARVKQKTGRTFKIWGYVPPTLSGASNATMTVYVERLNSHKKWVAVPSLDQTATLSVTGAFKNKTNYVGKLKINRLGKYRIQVKLVCRNASDVEVTKWSSRTTFKIVK
jgi:hypothetical protein